MNNKEWYALGNIKGLAHGIKSDTSSGTTIDQKANKILKLIEGVDPSSNALVDNGLTAPLELKLDAIARHLGVGIEHVPEHYECVGGEEDDKPKT
jgi:hypothetical protein